MALGDFPYPTSNLRLTHIAAGLNESESLDACCLSSNVVANGLQAAYCPGSTENERLVNLRADKKQSYFKGYNPQETPIYLYNSGYTVKRQQNIWSALNYPYTIVNTGNGPDQIVDFMTRFDNDYSMVEYIEVMAYESDHNDFNAFYNNSLISPGLKMYNNGLSEFEYGDITPITTSVVQEDRIIRLSLRFKFYSSSVMSTENNYKITIGVL